MQRSRSFAKASFKPFRSHKLRALLAAEFVLGSISPSVMAFSSWSPAGGGNGFNHQLPAPDQTITNHPVLHSAVAQPSGSAGHWTSAYTHATSSNGNFQAGMALGLSHSLALRPVTSPLPVPHAINLDLASTAANITLGTNLFQNADSITINVGGTSRTFTAGQHVTAAEYLALKQSAAGGTQTLTVSKNGVASGGSFDLNVVSPIAAELLVPSGVTGIDNLSSNSTLKVNGDIINYGSLYFVSNNANANQGSIIGKEIINERGGVISTTLPNTLVSSLPSAGAGALHAADLTLTAADKISNAGLITSAGNINLIPGTGNLINTGTINSATGNINITMPAATSGAGNLNVSAVGGTFSAVNGNINIGAAQAANPNNQNINMLGGNYLSRELNIDAGHGAITGTIGTATGTLNTQGDNEHFSASTPLLILGSNNIDGDPTFANTAVNGGIVITSVNNFTENVAILANGDITISGNGQIVDPGKDVTIIAGATVTTTGITTGTIPGKSATASVQVSFNPTTSNGGNIDFSAGTTPTVIDTSTPTGGGSAGNVLLVAMASDGGSGGSVLLGKNSINASALNQGTFGISRNGGNVQIIAGANPTTKTATVTVGSITTGGGFNIGNNGNGPAYKGGDVEILTQQPKANNSKNLITFDTKGTLAKSDAVDSNGLTINNAGVTLNGDIITTGSGGLVTAGASAGKITITAGSDLNAQNLFAYGSGGGSDESVANATPGRPGGNGAPISLFSQTGDITIAGTVSSAGGGGGGSTGSRNAASGGSGGAGADVTIVAAGGSITTGAIYTADGGAGGSSSPGSRDKVFTGVAGGGGGSYGGGGAGAGDGESQGGGGGGGIFGGGGGAAHRGDGGGTAGGINGGGAATDGSAGQGGNSNAGSLGGALGQGGAGAPGVPPVPGNPGVGAGQAGAPASGGKSEVTLSAIGDITTNGALISGTIDLATTGKSNITIGANVTASALSNITTLNGNITQGAGVVFAAGTLTLNTSTGTVGTSATPLTVAGGTLALTSDSGGSTNGAFINSNSDLLISRAVTNGTFQVNSKGGVATKNTTIIAPVIVLNAVGGLNVDTQTQDLTTTSGTSTTIQNTGALILNVAGSKAGTFYSLTEMSGTGKFDQAALTINGNITAGGALTIALKSSATAQGNGIFLGPPVPTLTASSIAITVNGGSPFDIGSLANPMQTVTSALSFKTAGSVWVSNTGSVTVSNSEVGPGKNGTTSASFRLSTIADAGGNGAITVGAGGLTVTTGTQAGLTSSLLLNSTETTGTGGIAITGGGVLTANQVSLFDGPAGAGNGSIGLITAPIKIDATSLQMGGTGGAYINNSNTGNLTVFDSPLASAVLQLISKGSIDTLPGFGLITAGNVLLASGAGKSIGIDQNTPARVSAANLTLSGGKSVFVTDPATGAINLNITIVIGVDYNNQATDTFSFVAPNSTNLANIQAIKSQEIVFNGGSYSNVGALTAGKSIDLTATGATALSLITPISAPVITLSAGNGVITQVAPNPGLNQPGGGITATKSLTLNLTATGGNVNLTLAPNKVGVLNDSVTGSGTVQFTENDSTKLGSIVGAGQNLTLNYTSSLTNTTAFTINQLTITPSLLSKNDSIKLVAPITGTLPIALTADGSGGIDTAGLIGTGDRTLTASGTGSIKLDGSLTGQQITISTNGGNITQGNNAAITAAAGLQVNLQNGGTADLTKTIGNIPNLSDNVTGKGAVLVASFASVTLQSIVGPTQNLTVFTGGALVAPTAVPATTLVLQADGAGGIGSAGLPVTTSATNLTLFAVEPGANVFAVGTSTSPLTLQGSGANNIFSLTAGGAINVTGPVSGGTINLTSGSNGNIALSGPVGTASSIVALTANGSGNVTTKTASDLVTGQSVTVASTGGSLMGAAAKAPLVVATTSLALNTGGSGIVDVLDTTTSATTLGASSSGQGFAILTSGLLNINNVTTAAGAAGTTGNISLTDKVGNLNVMPSAILTAQGGNILLQNNDVKGGSISIGNGAKITASSTTAGVGNVTINIGPKAEMFAGTAPTNVTPTITPPGAIFYGKNGITALGPTNLLNALGRNIVFDTDSTSAGTIQLGGAVTIQADPPATAVAAAPAAVPTISLATAAAAPSASVDKTIVLVGGVNTAHFGTGLELPSPGVGATQSTPPAYGQVQLVNLSNSATTSLNQNPAQQRPSINISALPWEDSFDETIDTGGYRLIDATLCSASTLDQERGVNPAVACRIGRSGSRTGNTLYAGLGQTKLVETPYGIVKIGAQAVVFLMELPHGIGVFNMDDRSRDDVVVAVGGTNVRLAPGQHMLITRKIECCFEEINAAENIQFRNVKKAKVSETRAVFYAEFHLPSALGVIKPLTQLLTSTSPSDRNIGHHVLKTAAIMDQLTSNGASYRSYGRPSLTATNFSGAAF